MLTGLRCRILQYRGLKLAIEQWTGTREALLDKRDAPLAYLVGPDALALIRAGGGLVDRGRKHPAKPLTTLLLGRKAVTVIDGDFRSAGQLARSVRTLLTSADRRHERNIYVVGITSELFDRLKATAAAPPADDRTGHLVDPEEVPAELVDRLVGESPAMQRVRELIVLASRRSEPVLVVGETGTGKEVVARAIHALDPMRQRHPFVVVNCTAISPELFESEVFGYRRGAFTGAHPAGSRGLWAAAHLGTLFLDEIGDLPLGHQSKILRALEANTIRPVGSESEQPVDSRVVAATNRNLKAMVKSGQFRKDLYFRLVVSPIPTPRLHDHPEDIPALAKSFWRTVAPGRAALSDEVLAALSGYCWPGNARELRSVLSGLTTMFPKAALEAHHVEEIFKLQNPPLDNDEPVDGLDDVRRACVECLRLLRRADGRLTAKRAEARASAALTAIAKELERLMRKL